MTAAGSLSKMVSHTENQRIFKKKKVIIKVLEKRSGLLTSSTGHWNAVIAWFTFTAAKKKNPKKQGTYTDVNISGKLLNSVMVATKLVQCQ